MQEHKTPLIAVELLRFVSAVAVMGLHFGVNFWRAPDPRSAILLKGVSYNSPGEQWLQFGWLGVEVFFIISGMVIARSAVGVSTGAFLRRRALRLAPCAWICATITVAALSVLMRMSDTLAFAWARSVLFWPTGDQIDSSYWTLGIELAFYLAIAASLGAAGKRRRIEHLGMAIGTLSALFWIGTMIAGPNGAWLYLDRSMQLLLLPFGCFFGLGVVIAGLQADGLTPGRAGAFVLLGTTAAVEVAVHSIERANSTGLPLAVGTPLILFALALAALVTASWAQPLLARFVNPGAARAIGLLTYPLYLVHQEVGAVVIAAARTVGLPTGACILVAAIFALAAAGAVARWAEPAVRRALARGFNVLGTAVHGRNGIAAG